MAASRRATSADVAHRAGVSRATVSYVLNDVAHQSIPLATRQRVLAAARELDYTPHAAARALRAGQSRLVLLINTGVPYGTNLSVMIDALASEVAASGRSLVIWQQRDADDLPATLAHLQPAVALTLGRLTVDQRAALIRAHIPHVESDADPPDAVDVGAALQVNHLVARGHRRLGCLTTTDPRLAAFAEPRVRGVQASCTAQGLAPALVAELPDLAAISVADLAEVLRRWTSGTDPVTGIACYNDVCAAACLAAADRADIAVPGRLAVVGMDDEPMSAFSRPALTTVRLPMVDHARALWADARALLEGEPAPPRSDGPPFSLIERASS